MLQLRSERGEKTFELFMTENTQTDFCSSANDTSSRSVFGNVLSSICGGSHMILIRMMFDSLSVALRLRRSYDDFKEELTEASQFTFYRRHDNSLYTCFAERQQPTL